MANHLPFLPFVGQRPSVTDFRRIRDAIRANSILDGKGYKVDRTPQGVRLQIKGVTNFVGGGGGTSLPGRFEAAIDPDTGAVTLANCYYRIGGKTYSLASSTPQVPAAGEIWALKISIYSATPSATIARYAALGALQTAERDPDYFIAPLYEFEADPEDASRCVIKCDFRIGPDAAMGEFGS